MQCGISWYDERRDCFTDDENNAIGVVYQVNSRGKNITQREYPICAEHKAWLDKPSMKHWHFEPF